MLTPYGATAKHGKYYFRPLSSEVIYLRVHTYGYVSGWSSKDDKSAFYEECRRLFQELGWTLHTGADGVCDTVTMGQQDLYLHPTSFSGVMDENNIQPLMEQLSKAKTLQCYAFDRYEECHNYALLRVVCKFFLLCLLYGEHIINHTARKFSNGFLST